MILGILGYETGEKKSTPWHERGGGDTSLKLYFGMDFEQYWFNPLADLFGIPGDQATKLGREVAIRQLGVSGGETYQSDPRRGQWQSGNDEGGTWHDHGNYPRVHDHMFYYAYHS